MTNSLYTYDYECYEKVVIGFYGITFYNKFVVNSY